MCVCVCVCVYVCVCVCVRAHVRVRVRVCVQTCSNYVCTVFICLHNQDTLIEEEVERSALSLKESKVADVSRIDTRWNYVVSDVGLDSLRIHSCRSVL